MPPMNAVTGAAQSPADRRRQQVRDKIVSAADRVVEKLGVEGLSIRRLAGEIDYSPAAIYKYFSSKDELITELKEAFFERLIENIERVRASDGPFMETFKACVAVYIETALERPHHYSAAFTLGGSDAGATDLSSEASYAQRAFQTLCGLIAEGVQLGEFGDLDVELAAESQWASMHGLSMLLIHLPAFRTCGPSGREAAPDEIIARHIDFFIRSLRA